MTDTKGSGPGRPDTWVESLAFGHKTDDAMPELVSRLALAVAEFGVTRPRVVVGHSTGLPALEALRRATGMPLTALDSFDLAGDHLGQGTIGFPSREDWMASDGVLCLDPDSNAYMNSVQFAHDAGVALPVLADLDSIAGQFCQIAVATGDPETEIFIYNYFTKLYRIKDPLQLVWRTHWSDGTCSCGSRLLGPNDNLRLRVSELDPPAGAAAGTLVYEAHHPAFARVPNSRFRGVVDVIGPTYCATLHGDELEPKRVGSSGWFDTHVAPLGDGYDIRVVVRNDVRERGAVKVHLSAAPATGGTARTAEVDLPPEAMEREVSLASLFGADGAAAPTEIVARVEGRSYRLEWKESWSGPGGQSCFQSNHGSTNDVAMAPLVAGATEVAPPDPHLFERFRRLEQRGVLPLPYPMPVFPAADPLRLSFSAGKFLPHLEYVNLAAFDRGGRLIGLARQDLPADLGYVEPGETAFAEALSEQGGLLLISPPYVEKGLVAYQNCREDLWLKLSNTQSGDSDISEFQVHNRNLSGYTVPIGFGQAPQMIKARTDMMIRVRQSDRFESRLLLINASPELGFDRTGEVELELNLPGGTAVSQRLELAPQTWRFDPVGDLFPELTASGGFGWVRVISDQLALSAYMALIDHEGGGLGFQHLWGA